MTDHTMEEKRNHAVLVGLHASSLSQEENASDATLEELEALLETAGGVCVGSVLQNRETPEARTFIGEGKVAEVAVARDVLGTAPLLLLDDVMSELDGERRGAFLRLIGDDIQTVITTTNLGYFTDDLLDRAKVVSMGETC